MLCNTNKLDKEDDIVDYEGDDESEEGNKVKWDSMEQCQSAKVKRRKLMRCRPQVDQNHYMKKITKHKEGD